MQSMKLNDDEKETVTWPRFRDNLRIDRLAIDYVKDHADFPRHGRPSSITDEQRKKVFEITDEIIRGFVEYVAKGKSKLKKNDLPQLKN